MEEKFLNFVADVMEVDVSKISMDTQYKVFEYGSICYKLPGKIPRQLF